MRLFSYSFDLNNMITFICIFSLKCDIKKKSDPYFEASLTVLLERSEPLANRDILVLLGNEFFKEGFL